MCDAQEVLTRARSLALQSNFGALNHKDILTPIPRLTRDAESHSAHLPG